MKATASITRAALDTLSSQVAVLDEEGTICFTNNSWGTDDGAGMSSEAAEINYFDAVDPTADEYAADAVTGIRSVIDGDRESFTLEYPCHTDERKQWFLMRATPFTLGTTRYVTVTHIDITDRRLAELDAQDHAERAEQERGRLEHLIERINGLVQDITKLLVEAQSRGEIETGVCERLADAKPYVYAWTAAADFAADRLTLQADAGVADAEVDAVTYSLADDTGDPTVRAYTEGEVVTVQSIDTDTRLGQVYGDAGVEAVMAVPIASHDTAYGVLTVCADQPDAFDEREQAVLEALGRATANTLDALESKQTLTADRIVEMEFTVDDETCLPARLSAAADCTLTYSGSVYDDEGHIKLFYRVRDIEAEAALGTVANDDAVVDVTLLAEYDDETLLGVTCRSSLVAALADRGAVTKTVTASEGIARFTVELPQDGDARSLFEFVDDGHDGTELVSYHEHDRPVQTRQEFRDSLEDRLTDRQLTALRTAYYSGFFDWPRDVNGDELAETMDISRSTFHQHLRTAERKVFDAFFDRA